MPADSQITARRKALLMTQDILAGAACVSRSTVQRAERGLPISVESLRSIRAVLGIAGDQGEMVPDAPPAEPSRVVREPGLDRRALCAVDLVTVLAVGFLATAAPRAVVLLVDLLHEDNSVEYGYWILAFSWAVNTLAVVTLGRCAWRRWARPGADAVRFLAIVPDTASRARRILRFPMLRWTRRGRPVDTWQGGLTTLLLFGIAFYAFHLPTFAPMLPLPSSGAGYAAERRVSAAWDVEPGSPLEKAGLKVGDQLVSVDGKHVGNYLRADMLVLDAEGRRVVFRVARPHAGAGRWPGAADMVDLEVSVTKDPVRSCGDTAPCGWVGRLHALFTPTKLWPSVGEQAETFITEVAHVARMAVDADARRASFAFPGAMRFTPFFAMARFSMVAEGAFLYALAGLAIAIALLCIRDGLGPAFRRAGSLGIGRFRFRGASTGQLRAPSASIP